jgi:hypothetical protein
MLATTSASYAQSVTVWPDCANVAASAVPQLPAPMVAMRFMKGCPSSVALVIGDW